jgi:hypothetical protein
MPGISAGQAQRTASQVMARPMIIRRIPEAPSKIVKISGLHDRELGIHFEIRCLIRRFDPHQ